MLEAVATGTSERGQPRRPRIDMTAGAAGAARRRMVARGRRSSPPSPRRPGRRRDLLPQSSLALAWTLITIFRATFDGLLAGEDPRSWPHMRPEAARAYDQLANGLGDYGVAGAAEASRPRQVEIARSGCFGSSRPLGRRCSRARSGPAPCRQRHHREPARHRRRDGRNMTAKRCA
jgi:hypothetical protein